MESLDRQGVGHRCQEVEPGSIRILLSSAVNDETAEVPSVNFDTDGVTFIIDNSATCILCNDRSLFVGPLKPADTCVQTTSGFSSPQFAGTI